MNAPIALAEKVTLPEAPGARVSEVTDWLSVKSGFPEAAAVTVSVSAVALLMLPPVPMMVNVYVPAAVAELTAIVMLDDPDPTM